MSSLNPLFSRLGHVLSRDYPRLRRRLRELQGRKEAPKAALVEISAEIEASAQRRMMRAQNLLRPQFPEELPVSQRREEIARAIAENQVLIVAGETGSGKTTQLPKICLSAGRGVAGMIGCTQPRRIAARSIATRIAAELQTPIGHAVGWQVRFTERVSADSYIKLMTDGILLAEIQTDRFLNAYDTIILDEAHERSLNIDFLLGYLRELLPKRKDLKLIVTSATIDTARFADHFWNAPVIQVEGRGYPVETRYRPLADSRNAKKEQEDKDLPQAILDAVDEISRDHGGDILVFLPGEREIRETAEALRKHHPPHTEVVPLYARLSAAEQNRVFEPGSLRRIVLATNVAETSLTVPRIHAVIDPGFARVSRYSTRSKVQHLLVEPISRASADQRKGRCGRIAAGLCIRLYEESDFLSRPEFTDPEILRTSLAAVILRMLHLRLGDIEDFPFLEPPDSRQITDGVKLLEELGAVDKNRRLTEIGKQLAPLPVDPRLGRMLLAARQSGCLNEALIIAAALSVQDPRERPLDMQQAADLAQAQFQDENSDFVSFLKLWEFFQENAKHLSKSKLRKLCRDKFLSWTRMQEWQDIHQQLFTLAREHKWPMNEVPADYMSLHRALLTGLLGNIATVALASKDRADEANKSKNPKPDGYQGARGIKLYLFPGSGLFKKHPRWLMAAELVETGRLYARCAAKIEPEWIEQAAGALCRRSYFEPHWEKSSARVAAYEQVTVYGLTVVNRRKVDYSRIDPAACREIFIRAALVEGDYNSRAAFFLHNQKLVAEIRDMEHKARRPDILVDEQEIFAFYDARLPADIVGGAELDQWRREAEREAPKLLFLSREQLMRRDGVSRDEFPETLEIQGLRLKLSYQFEPGLENDGVTVQIPVQVLSQLRPARFDWLVPGLLKEKIAALLRGLPGATRRNFVPVPDFAQAAFEALTPGDTPLTAALGEYLHRISGGVTILPQDWKWDTLPPHLRCNFAILAENGEKLAQGRDLTSLQQQWKDRAQAGFASLPKAGLERDKVTAWDFGDLPDQVTLEAKGLKFPGFPALAEAGECAALKVFNDAAAAVRSHRAGLRCLLQHLAKTQLAQLRRQVPAALCLRYMALGSCDSLKDDLAAALLDKVFLAEPLPRRQADFEQRLKQGLARLFAEAAEMFKHLQDSLEAWNELRGLLANRGLAPAKDLKQLKGTLNPASHAALKDLRDHLEKLVYPGFVRACPPLQHFPRYLKAAQTRLQRLEQAPDKDARKAVELAPLWNAYWQRRPPQPDAAWQEFRWLLEEWRVSLFAQELKTAAPVSAQRMQKMWKELAG